MYKIINNQFYTLVIGHVKIICFAYKNSVSLFCHNGTFHGGTPKWDSLRSHQVKKTEVPSCICSDLKWCNAACSTAMLPLPGSHCVLPLWWSSLLLCLLSLTSRLCVPLKRQPLVHHCCHGKQTTKASLTRGGQFKSCLAALKLRDFIVIKSNLKLLKKAL